MKKIIVLALLLMAVCLSPLVALAETPNFRAVSHISLSSAVWRVGVPFDFSEMATLWPARYTDDTPTVNDIQIKVINEHYWRGELFPSVNGSVLNTTGQGQGTIRVLVTIANGLGGGIDFTQEVNITFSSTELTARLEGLDALYSGVEREGRVVFELTQGMGTFSEEIFPQDFFVRGLPWGLYAETAERLSDTEVAVKIKGTPSFSYSDKWTITTPVSVPARNFWQGHVAVAVLPNSFDILGVTASANVWTNQFTFDLNPNGYFHRDINVSLNPREFSFSGMRYGQENMREGTDFARGEFNENVFAIKRDFLARLPVGQRELTFMMSLGQNPSVTINIIDTAQVTPYTPYFVPAPPPAPPSAPPTPDESFIYLTGGTAVATGSLRWDINRARVTPEVRNGTAQVTVRSHVLDHLSWTLPNQSFEIFTPLVRVQIPSDLLNTTIGARSAVANRGLRYDQVDVRISIIERTNDPKIKTMFDAVYANGEILTPVAEILVELVNAATDEVIFTAHEFSRPLEFIFTVMDNAAHLRPAAVMFKRAWLEFVPYRSFSPNEITVRSIFPGIVTIMHNRVHFEDIYSAHWGFVQSYTAGYSGIVSPSQELAPQTNITRGEFALLLSIALQLPRANAEISGFVDVLPNNVYFDGVSRLFSAGLLGPYRDGSRFYPNAIITREEMASIIGMAIARGTPTRSSEHRPISIAFTDSAMFSAAHLTNVQLTVNYGVMVGYPDSSFRPQGEATRMYALQAVMGLVRLLGVVD